MELKITILHLQPHGIYYYEVAARETSRTYAARGR